MIVVKCVFQLTYHMPLIYTSFHANFGCKVYHSLWLLEKPCPKWSLWRSLGIHIHLHHLLCRCLYLTDIGIFICYLYCYACVPVLYLVVCVCTIYLGSSLRLFYLLWLLLCSHLFECPQGDNWMLDFLVQQMVHLLRRMLFGVYATLDCTVCSPLCWRRVLLLLCSCCHNKLPTLHITSILHGPNGMDIPLIPLILNVKLRTLIHVVKFSCLVSLGVAPMILIYDELSLYSGRTYSTEQFLFLLLCIFWISNSLERTSANCWTFLILLGSPHFWSLRPWSLHRFVEKVLCATCCLFAFLLWSLLNNLLSEVTNCERHR
jgi:hypothetical protein